jgi:hypothetical protein
MSRSLQVRSPLQPPSTGIDRRLNLYSSAAVAAGVGLLALASPAEGSIVVTNTNIACNPGSSVAFDLNGDGKNDFSCAVAIGGYDHSFYATLAITPLTGGKVIGGARGTLGPYGSALASGANIGGSGHFSSSGIRQQVTIERSNGAQSGPTSSYKPYGQWAPGTNKFLGVRFLINGATHYGWIRLTISRTIMLDGAIRLSATITEYAYETTANKTITAGATAAASARTDHQQQQQLASNKGPSLGMLALGSGGLSMWRRESEAQP